MLNGSDERQLLMSASSSADSGRRPTKLLIKRHRVQVTFPPVAPSKSLSCYWHPLHRRILEVLRRAEEGCIYTYSAAFEAKVLSVALPVDDQGHPWIRPVNYDGILYHTIVPALHLAEHMVAVSLLSQPPYEGNTDMVRAVTAKPLAGVTMSPWHIPSILRSVVHIWQGYLPLTMTSKHLGKLQVEGLHVLPATEQHKGAVEVKTKNHSYTFRWGWDEDCNLRWVEVWEGFMRVHRLCQMLLGSHHRLGAASAVRRAIRGGFWERQLLSLILQYL